MAILSKLNYWFNAILIKIPTSIFAEIGKLILKFIWHYKGLQIVKAILKKKKAGRITLLNFTAYYKIVVIKTLWYWHKYRHKDQRNRIESPEINPYSIISWLSVRVPKSFNGGKMSFFNKWCWNNWIFLCKRM